MAEILMTKSPLGSLVPADEDAQEFLRKIKAGSTVRAKVVRPRNLERHRKYFALIGMLFDIWTETMPQGQTFRGRPIMPNKDRFRRDLIILTGRFDATYAANGEVRVEAHSISFSSMSQDEFEKLYSDTIQVALDKVLDQPGLTEEKVREYVDKVLAFD